MKYIGMSHDVGFADVIIRYMIMTVLMILAGIFQSFIIAILGVLVFLTAISVWCPLYQLLGIKI